MGRTRIYVLPNSTAVRKKPKHSITFLVLIVKLKLAEGFVFVFPIILMQFC